MSLHVPRRTGQKLALGGTDAEEAVRVSANEGCSRTTCHVAERLDLFPEGRRAVRRRDHGLRVRARRSQPGFPPDDEGAGAGCLCGTTARDPDLVTSRAGANAAGSGTRCESLTAYGCRRRSGTRRGCAQAHQDSGTGARRGHAQDKSSTTPACPTGQGMVRTSSPSPLITVI
jgi:hypothetical protein